MDLKKMKALLEKYYNGDTSIEEEKILKNYFERDDISDDFAADKDIFMYNIQEKSNLDSIPDISDQIWNNIEKQEVININNKKKSLNYNLLRIAASAIILIASFFLLKNEIFNDSQNIQFADTYDSPEQAYLEAKKTLLYVSELLNSGTDHLEPINKMEEGTSKLNPLMSFNNGLKELDPIRKYNIADKYIKH